MRAFADNVRLVYGDDPKPDAMIDVWSFARTFEPGGFLAAREDGVLVGYVLLSSSVKRLQRSALLSGRPLVWAWRALLGRYGIRWGALFKLLWNKVLFVGNENRYRTRGDAQLLNIAVAESARGRGVAKALVSAGLAYLHGVGVTEIRLEVRPDNLPAISAYRQTGFVERGRTRDIHGEWLVMTATP